jgi:hypothetical protein
LAATDFAAALVRATFAFAVAFAADLVEFDVDFDAGVFARAGADDFAFALPFSAMPGPL